MKVALGEQSPNAVPATRSLAVQIVLFNNRVDFVQRLVDSVAAASLVARESGMLDAIELLIGDSSPEPVLNNNDVSQIQKHAAEQGLTPLSYTFFNDNLGSGGGSNRLGMLASTDLMLVLNPDTYLRPDTIAELVSAMHDPTVGAADARQIPIEHPKEFDSHKGDTSFASGACMMIRRSVFNEVNGFDAEHFPMYCDDVDFSWRVRLAGFRVIHVAKASVAHQKSLQHGVHVKASANELYMSELARLLMIHKWGSLDLRDDTAAFLRSTRNPDAQRAVEEFTRRLGAGKLPERIENAVDIAKFVGTKHGIEYAAHRW